MPANRGNNNRETPRALMMNATMKCPAPLLLLVLSLIIAGCASPRAPEEEQQAAPQTLQGLLQAASDSDDRSRSQRYRLQAVEMLQQQEDYQGARQLLQTLSTEPMDPPERDQYLLLSMESIVATGDRRWARSLSPELDRALPRRLPEALQERALQMQLKTQLMANQPVRAALALIHNDRAAENREQGQRHDRIWRLLRSSPEADLEKASREYSDSDTQGWLELALVLSAGHGASMESQSATVRRWQENWPNHPAAITPPRELQLIARLSRDRPRRIALALPLSGPLGSAGQAIREGFMAAVYDEFGQNGGDNTSVDIYDTHARPFDEIYAALLTDSPDLVVGPLGKEDLSGLKDQSRLPIPILAMGYLEADQPVPENLYQFGLSGEDEARQVAERLALDGHRNAVLIAPEGDWGQRMESHFQQH
ncbi:MAG: penicillin-binding protein activator, partial [Oleiphilaceae bacterium]|nr:penicillin-binding protein activator [Oleiphilaceae bacterium]